MSSPLGPLAAIRTLGDPVLRMPALEVVEFDDALRVLANRMVAVMRHSHGVGLAANQIGSRQKVCVWDAGHGLKILANPQVVRSTGSQSDDERCLSIPGVTVRVSRAQRLVVAGQDLTGQDVTISARDFEARVMGHELDHLNGRLLVDYRTIS